MSIVALKRWHWTLLGIVGGFILATAHLLALSNQPVGGPGFVSRAEFERDLHLPPILGKVRMRSIVIHPKTYVDVVSFQQLEPATLEYQDRVFAAPRPYVRANDPAGDSSRTVEDYLTGLAAANRGLSFHTAWWDALPPVLLLYPTIGAMLIGGFWPMLLRLLVGRLTDPKDDYDLSRFHGESKSQAPAGHDGDAERRLKELEAELIAGLETESPEAAVPSSTNLQEPTLRSLSSQPLLEASPPTSGSDKRYAGEFYPVEKRASAGFSLIELVVAIAIVAILISLLLPAIDAARQRAQTVQCMSQLSQLGKALHLYANANQGSLPAWSNWHTWPPGGTDDSSGPAWTIELIPYLGSPDSPIYNCPSFPGPVHCRNYFLAAQWSGHNNRHAMKLSDITMTGRFVLSGDKTQRGLYPPPFGTNEHQDDDADPDDFGGGMPVLAWPWDEGGFYMHRGGNNVLFDDLHVELFAAYDPAAMTFNPRGMEDWADVTPD